MKKLKVNFNFGYSVLAQLGDKFAILLGRDANELKDYGINNTHLANLQQKTQEFKNFFIDEHYEMQIRIAVEEKNKWRETIQVGIRKILDRMELAYGEKSAKYMSVSVNNLSQLSDSEYHRYVKFIINTAQADMSTLQTVGLTQAHVDDLNMALQKLDDAIDTKIKLDAVRSIATEQRTQLANDLYDLIIYIAKCGKSVFEGISAAHYKDYLIYERNPNSSKPTINVSANSITAIEKNVEATETYYIEYEKGEGEIYLFSSGSESPEMYSEAVKMQVGENAEVVVSEISDGTGTRFIFCYNPHAQAAKVFVEKRE